MPAKRRRHDRNGSAEGWQDVGTPQEAAFSIGPSPGGNAIHI